MRFFKMKSNNTYFIGIYNTVFSAVDGLNEARQTLGHFDYLTDDENILLRHSQHLLYQKLVAIGEDIKRYEKAEITASIIPEFKEEQTV